MNEIDLFQLVRMGNRNEVIPLLNETNIQVRNEFGQNLLHEAIAFNQEEIAKDLLRLGIDVNCQDNRGATPLHFAAAHRSPTIARDILRAGGAVNLQDQHGNMPLWTAVFNAKGDYATVNLFIQAQADPNAKNRKGRSPLDFARQIKDQQLISILEDSA